MPKQCPNCLSVRPDTEGSCQACGSTKFLESEWPSYILIIAVLLLIGGLIWLILYLESH